MATAEPSAAVVSNLISGCNSFAIPQSLNDTQYVASENTINRGGMVQTRPGSRTKHCLPSGNLQGGCYFSHGPGIVSLVSVVDGVVYYSDAPFTVVKKINGIQFSPNSRFVSFAKTVQSTTYDTDGIIQSLDVPKQVLIIQDGATRAAYWDGSTGAHINPTMSTDPTKTLEGSDGTKIGLWSAWSNQRLWVSRGNQVFASDIGNPLKFTEAQYLNEGRAFYLPGDCTGMAESPDQSGIFVFTDNTTTFIQTSITDRTQWLATKGMASVIFPSLGCLAPRSIVSQYGLLWWFSSKGMVSLDSAYRQNISSRIDVKDRAMTFSKSYLGPDCDGICGGWFENYLVMSVPSGSRYNRHTWVLDQSPSDIGDINSWSSIWTGWRPIAWDTGHVDGTDRCFFWSIDHDGFNRVWEGFLPEKKDNGCPITCWLQTKDHDFGLPVNKRFGYAYLELKEVLGDVSISINYAGEKGAYQNIATTELAATEGQVYPDETYGSGATDNKYSASRPQTRVITTDDSPSGNGCSDCNVESDLPSQIDNAFSLLIIWSGIMGIHEYRIYAYQEGEPLVGGCSPDESDPKVLAADGCSSSSDYFVDTSPFTTYTSTKSDSVIDRTNGLTITSTKTATSLISQADADNKANQATQMDLAWKLGCKF